MFVQQTIQFLAVKQITKHVPEAYVINDLMGPDGRQTCEGKDGAVRPTSGQEVGHVAAAGEDEDGSGP